VGENLANCFSEAPTVLLENIPLAKAALAFELSLTPPLETVSQPTLQMTGLAKNNAKMFTEIFF
jgi:hypothetical protein